MSKVYKYIVDFQANTEKFNKEVGGTKGMLKAGAAAFAGFFAAEKIIEAAGAVVDYGKEIDAIRTKTMQLTGLTGGALNAVTGEVKAVANVYGKEWEEVLKAANAMSKQFGITNKESLDVMRKGLASGADTGGDFLEQISEYSTQFKAAGASAAEMVSIMSQSGKAGIFSDKGADTIKEGMLRIREMTTSTVTALEGIGLNSRDIQQQLRSGAMNTIDVIKLVSARLRELPATSAEVGAAIADIFGGAGEDAGLDYIKTLADINLNLNDVFSNTDEASRANDAYIESQARLHAISAAVFGGMGTGWTKAKTAVLDFVQAAITQGVKVINWFIDLYNESVVFRAYIEQFKAFWTSFGDVMGGVFKLIWNNLKSTGKLLKAVFTADFKAIPDIIKEGFSNVLTDIGTMGKNVAENYATAFNNTVKPKGKVSYINMDMAEEQATAGGEQAGNAFALALGGALGEVKKIDKLNFKFDAIKPLDEDLFDMNTAEGQMNRMGAAIAEVDAAMKKSLQTSILFGSETDRQVEKQAALKDGLMALVNEGYSANSAAVQGLIAYYKAQGIEVAILTDSQKRYKDLISSMAASIMDYAKVGAESFEEMGSAILNSIRNTIKAYLAEAIAASVASSMSTAPFPFNILAAPVAAAAATTAFNQLIPAFADGGLVYGPTVGLMGEYAGAKSNPEVIAPLDKLKSMIRSESGGGTGEVRFEIEGGKLVGVLNNYNKRVNSYR